MGDADKKKDGFTCRICRGVLYSPVYKAFSPHDIIGPGHGGAPLYYECDGCSTLFKRPDKFSLTPISVPPAKPEALPTPESWKKISDLLSAPSPNEPEKGLESPAD